MFELVPRSVMNMYKIIAENYDISQTSKTHFGQYLVYFSK